MQWINQVSRVEAVHHSLRSRGIWRAGGHEANLWDTLASRGAKVKQTANGSICMPLESLFPECDRGE